MATKPAPDAVSTILAALVYRREGCPLNEITTAFADPPASSTTKLWVDGLIADGLVSMNDDGKPYLYYTTHAGVAYYHAHRPGRAGAASVVAAVGDRGPEAQPALNTPGERGAASADPACPPKAGEGRSAIERPAGVASAASGADNHVGLSAGDGDKSVGDRIGDRIGDAPSTGSSPDSSPDRLSNSSPAAAGSSAVCSAASAGSDNDDFRPLFEGLLFSIVAGVMPRASALGLLQTWPSPALADAGRRSRFVQYGLDRLSHLTLGECLELGLQPGQFELWRRQYFPSAQPAPTPKAAASSAPDGAQEARGARTAPPRAVMSGSEIKNRESKIENSTTPQSTSPAAGEVVAGVLTPLLSAVLTASPAPLTAGYGAPATPPTTASAGHRAANPALTRTSSAASKQLAGWLARVTGVRDPILQTVLVIVGTSLIGWLLSQVAASRLLAGLATAAVIAGVLAWRGFAAHRKSQVSNLKSGAAGSAGPQDPAASVIENRESRFENPSAPGSGFRFSLFLAALGLLAVGTIVTVIWYRHTQRPPEAALRDHLVRSVAPLPVRVAALTPTYGAATATGCPITYQVRFATIEPLYRRIDLIEYLRAHAPNELAAIEAAAALLRQDQGPATNDHGLGIPQSASPARSLNSQPSTLNLGAAAPAPLLVTTATPPGATALASGSVVAWRNNGVWVFTGSAPTLDRTAFAGEPKPAGALAVDQPADLARLNEWLAAQVAAAAKAQAEATAAAAERERVRVQQTAAFAQLLRPGTLFTGTISDPIRRTSQRVILEFTATTDQQLSAVLRNDGGWTDARAFAGDWTLAPTGNAAVVSLRTSTRDYVDGAGPLLQDRLDWALTMNVSVDGTAAATAAVGSSMALEIENRDSKIKNPALRRIDPVDAPAFKAEVLRPLAPAIAATAGGRLYRGTAISRIYRTTETLLLRFTDQNGLELRATLESPTATGAVRPLRGSVVSNTYRVANAPIQLVTMDADRVVRADAHAVLSLATGNGIRLALRVEGDRVVGEDPYYTYTFAPDTGANTEAGSTAPTSPSSSSSSSPADSALNAQSSTPDSGAAAPALPPFPTAAGAYVLIGDGWVALPVNNGKVYQTVAQKLLEKLLELHFIEDAAAGQVNPPPKDVVGSIGFDGKARVPVASGSAVVVAYVGPLAPPKPADIKLYKPLADYPALELVRLQLGDGMRVVPLFLIGPHSLGFGAERVDATVERPRPNVTVLRCQRPLGAGRYALSGAAQPYELETK